MGDEAMKSAANKGKKKVVQELDKMNGEMQLEVIARITYIKIIENNREIICQQYLKQKNNHVIYNELITTQRYCHESNVVKNLNNDNGLIAFIRNVLERREDFPTSFVLGRVNTQTSESDTEINRCKRNCYVGLSAYSNLNYSKNNNNN